MSSDRPIVVGSHNGLNACLRAHDLLRQQVDPVDALVAGVRLVEDDPQEHAVGYGGLPNSAGTVELDACVMDGRSGRAGAVAGLRHVRHAAAVAARVLRDTDHVLLVGEGALQFARRCGFVEEELLTDETREIWQRWRAAQGDRPWHFPEADREAARRLREHGAEFHYGTVTLLALAADGHLAGCVSTSGLSYKLPGRAGDSPIVGAGLYVDDAVGAAGSTGRGEASLLNCASFLVVELMRAGHEPADACRRTLERVAERTEARLRDAYGRPNYQLSLYALRKDGAWGGAHLRDGRGLAVCDSAGARVLPLNALVAGRPEFD